MTSNTCRSRVSISASYHLIARTYTQCTQYRLHACRSRVQAYRLLRTAAHSNKILKLLCLRTRCNPTRAQRFRHHLNLRLTHVRWRKRDILLFHIIYFRLILFQFFILLFCSKGVKKLPLC